MDFQDVQDVLFELIDTLDHHSIEYAVMGGLAVRMYALPRPTQDVDVNVGVSPDDSQEFLRRLDEAGFDVPEAYAAGWSDA